MTRILFALALVACSRPSTEPLRQPVRVVATPAAPASTEPSIYDLGLTLRDARGEQIGLDSARGRPVVMTMFYGSCAVACPAMIGEIKRVLAEVERDDVRVLLVSFDAARDTPTQLAALAKLHGLDERWILAAAAEPDARELAATIGFKYRALENGEFFHGSTILVLDEDGRPRARTDGFNNRAPLHAALR
jgi:protein SCO1/2